MAEPRDYSKQRRNTYGESPHASRKNIPRSRQRQHRESRRVLKSALHHLGEEAADRVASAEHAGWAFKKSPDQPLGWVLIADCCRQLVAGRMTVHTFRLRMRRLRDNYAGFSRDYGQIYCAHAGHPPSLPSDAVAAALAEFA